MGNHSAGTNLARRCETCGNKRCAHAVSPALACSNPKPKVKLSDKHARVAAALACEGASLALETLVARLRDLGTPQADQHANEAAGAATLAREWRIALRV